MGERETFQTMFDKVMLLNWFMEVELYSLGINTPTACWHLTAMDSFFLATCILRSAVTIFPMYLWI